MPRVPLTIALEHYDRHLPLLDGTVVPEGIDLEVSHVGIQSGRHERMLNDQEWDACEVSLSSYLMAKARGFPLTAIPVFTRRLFSQSQMYVNTQSGISTPRDLMGERVGLQSYQTTLAVLAKGDLQHEYGVPLEQVTWVTSSDEPIPFTPPVGVTIERTKDGEDIQEMLVTGAVKALFSSRVPRPFIAGSPLVAHLFPDPSAEEKTYYHRNGFYPIMHTIVMKNEVICTNPWIAMSLFEAFERAKQIAIGYYDDPNWTHLAWTSKLVLEQKEELGEDAWANGLRRNRQNLDRFVRFEVEQGLIPNILEVEDLFTATSLMS
ncbi:MAG: hypothetical protein BZY82_10085 [SAR202 cluster bacterium Io17-Chloro-G3]|nr:MAG: hypothetical protein BZY82_10085 [SAR202 cluster bacterium Io17-Chloro-G3]